MYVYRHLKHWDSKNKMPGVILDVPLPKGQKVRPSKRRRKKMTEVIYTDG